MYENIRLYGGADECCIGDFSQYFFFCHLLAFLLLLNGFIHLCLLVFLCLIHLCM